MQLPLRERQKMTIAALSTGGASQYVLASSNLTGSQQAWQTLQQSLASGNLSAAQTAFNTYQKINQNLTAMSGGVSSTSSQVTTDLTALGSALSSGDLSLAQQAFTTLQTDMKGTQSQALSSAMTAMAQTVQWVNDLVDTSASSSSTSTDPGTAALEAAYGGTNTGSTSIDPATQMLNSAYGTASTGSIGSTSNTSGATGSSIGSTINAYA